MITTQTKTHTLIKEPRISVARLADYMAASEQLKRSIISSCKYRPIARVIQHDDAKVMIAKYIRESNRNVTTLKEGLEALEARFFDTPFATEVNEHNCDYVRRFIDVHKDVVLPEGEYRTPSRFPQLELNGTRVSFTPDLIVGRTTRRNKRKIGALMLRYAKSKSLAPKTAAYQSAFIFRYLKDRPFEEAAEPEKPICITLDAHAGKLYPAPTNAVYLFNEMGAACASIAERWPAIAAPPGAIF